MMDRASLISEIQSRPAQTIVCERILVPIDGSPASMHAVEWAIELSRAADAELTILMVIDYDAHIFAFERIAFGSVSTHVTRHAHCLVLLAK